MPALLPGERISSETVAYLRELADLRDGSALKSAALEQRAVWKPAESWGDVNSVSRLFDPLQAAFDRTWTVAELDCVGAAMRIGANGGLVHAALAAAALSADFFLIP